MFDNQLEFSKQNNNEYFFDNNVENNNINYFDDLKNYKIEKENTNDYYKQKLDYLEQLEFTKQNNLNILLPKNPKPLIYQKTFIHKHNNKIKKNKFNKNKPQKKQNLIINNFNSKTTINISNPKGLFDPILKNNELDLQKKVQQQREERLNKIKNYDIKYGNKIKKNQIYNNYVELVNEIENKNAEKISNKSNKFYKIENEKKK